MTLFRFPVLLALLTFAGPVQAAEPPLDRRVDKLESELRAVQRKVFPGGSAKYFEPEFPEAPPPPPVTAGVPATSPIADLTSRVDSLERQLATLTGQVEQATYKARTLEEALTKFRADVEFRLGQIETGGMTLSVPVVAPPAITGAKPPATKPAAPGTKTVAADPERVPPPATKPADPVEAQFQAAYLLYSNKQYDQANDALTAFVAKNPRAGRASHAQYWLGRSLLAQKQPASAAKAFLDNYRNMPKGARAPDSLYWLGQSLMTMTPPNAVKACEVYGELASVYAAKLVSPLKEQLAKARTTAKCAS